HAFCSWPLPPLRRQASPSADTVLLYYAPSFSGTQGTKSRRRRRRGRRRRSPGKRGTLRAEPFVKPEILHLLPFYIYLTRPLFLILPDLIMLISFQRSRKQQHLRKDISNEKVSCARDGRRDDDGPAGRLCRRRQQRRRRRRQHHRQYHQQ